MLKRQCSFSKRLLLIFGLIILVISGCKSGSNKGNIPGNNTSELPEKYVQVDQWGEAGPIIDQKWAGTADQFDMPSAITVDHNNNVYIVDSDRVLNFESDGSFLGWWGDHKEEVLYTFAWHEADSPEQPVIGGMLRGSAGIDIIGDYLYVSCINTVFKFNIEDHSLLNKFEDSTFDFVSSNDVAAEEDGTFYVASSKHILQKMAPDGTFIGWWGGDRYLGNGWHFAESGKPSPVYGSENGQFYNPLGIAKYNNYIYIADLNGVHRFDANTKAWISTWSGSLLEQLEPDKLLYPQGICLDLNGNVFVCDIKNIKKFDPNGRLLALIDKRVKGVAIGSNGELYAVDQANSKVIVFQKQ